VIEDALKVGFTRDRALIERFLAEVEEHLNPLPYRTWHTLVDDARHRVRVRLQRAGHILGSAYVEVDLLERESGRAVPAAISAAKEPRGRGTGCPLPSWRQLPAHQEYRRSG